MSSFGLLFIGAVLLANGLVLVGRIEARAAAPINALVGFLLVGVTLWLALPERDLTVAAHQDRVISAAGFLLFALTYLWVAFNAWTGHPTDGLGWYCGWAAIVSVFFAVVSFERLHDTKESLLWVLWAVLFAAFFTLLALGQKRIGVAAGWLAIMEAAVTTTVPGALLLLGRWTTLDTAWVAVATIVTIAVFAIRVLGVRRRRVGE